MIQIQSAGQFEKAAARLTSERQSVRRYEPGLYEVTNKAKGHTYHVRVEKRNGLPFGTCTCEAGTPTKGQRVPMVCKHLAATVIYLRALREMRRQMEAQTLGAQYDGDD
jgi:uncharacterized Zn finger protein